MPNPHMLSGAAALEAVKKCGDSLKYVRRQTPAICMAAVKQSGDSLRYVRNMTPAIAEAAVKRTRFALMYVRSDKVYDKLRAKLEAGTL